MKLKKNMVILSIIICYLISFSDEIPIESIVRKPEISDVSLSLDGKYVAALHNDSNDQGQMLTYNINRKEKKIYKPVPDLDVYDYYWVSNDYLVYYVSQQDGKYLCYVSSTDRDLNVESKRILISAYIKTYVLDGLLHDPDNYLIQKKYHSKYSIVGKMNFRKKRIRKQEKFWGEILWGETDFKGSLRLIKFYKTRNKEGNADFLYRESVEDSWKIIPLKGKTTYYTFTPDGQGFYIGTYTLPSNQEDCAKLSFDFDRQEYVCEEKLNKKFGRTKGLYIYNLKQNRFEKTVFYDSVFDFNGTLRFFSNPYKPSSITLKGITQWNDTVVTHWYDKKMETIQNKLNRYFPYSINLIYDADTSLNRFLFKSFSDTKRSEYYIYDVNADKITLLFKSCPWVKPELMSKTKPVTFQTRDSLVIHGYLTLPNKGKQPYPTVILIHGGPNVRDYWGFDPEVQVLASRGYAVFQINYRGSYGFGYKISIEERFKYHKMYLDIVDGTDYLISEGIADKNRIAVMGASFGGYLSICGITYEPDLYRCAVSNVGVFDWKKHVRSKKFKANNYVYEFYKANIGGGNSKEYLDFISPIHKVNNIKVPVLLTGGSEDKNVLISQSFSLFKKLKAAGVEVETFFKANERHGFQHQKNITVYYKKVLDFLNRNMPVNVK